MRRAALLLPLTLALAMLAACDRMNRQPKLKDYAPAALFANGQAMQAPAEGTVAVDDPQLAAADATRPPMSLALLQRGQDRYSIYCVMCHDAAGTGHGVVPSRGFPRPRDFAAPTQRQLTDRQIMETIGRGFGVMYGFADRVDAHDRWAITAYVRALQRASAPEAAGG